MKSVTAGLQGEHALIVENLGVLELLGPVDDELEFLSRYVDGCHHAKEELVLFPALVRRGVAEEALVEVALEQHKEGRRLLGEMRESRSRSVAKNYAELIRSHAEMEDSVTFAVAESALQDEEKESILASMESLSRDRCAGFSETATRLAQIWLRRP
ncbi:MAG: hemerythrin domain-containing protein [Conexivisphaera sp.]|jgi:hemerythrin-like domain-containing protein